MSPAASPSPSYRVPEALGESDAFLNFQQQVSRAAAVDRPVLIVGERGAGKELAARRLHYLSRRWEEPLVTLNCAALAPSLIESELFGHEAGAFTGATTRRTGRFETADGGSLFLDEIANIPLEVQEKILRVVEYGTFERVGSAESITVDVRIIGATNADLTALAADGRFKRDLLDRLSFEVLFLPPLRERGEDVLLLATHFAARMAVEMDLEGAPEFSEQVEQRLMDYDWPGNVRELKNAIERAVYRAGSAAVDRVDFRPLDSPYAPPTRAEDVPDEEPAKAEARTAPPTPDLETPLREAVRELEVSMVREALRRAKHNQKEAARLLGLTYHQFRYLYRKYADSL
ncbi:MAG: phage shock protein operon transcriptional activator [Candidatus Brocadiia bacterium]